MGLFGSQNKSEGGSFLRALLPVRSLTSSLILMECFMQGVMQMEEHAMQSGQHSSAGERKTEFRQTEAGYFFPFEGGIHEMDDTLDEHALCIGGAR